MEISKVIKENRMNKGLTQEELAGILNVSRSTISSWENGRSYPDLEMLLILSEEFEISVDSLLKGDKDIVREISNDTRNKKKNFIIKIVLSIVVAVLLVFLFYTQIRVKSIGKNDIEKATMKDGVVTIVLKNSLFYKDYAYMADSFEDEDVIEIKMSRQFSPFSDRGNVVEVKTNDLDQGKNKTVQIVDGNYEPIYTLENSK